MQEINHDELRQFVKQAYKTKVPLLVRGLYGIGKSYVTREAATQLAKERSGEFKEWNELSHEEKIELVKNPEGKFSFLDERIAQSDPTDFKGMPDLEGDYVRWMPQMWVKYASKPEADGLFFFDEVNLAGNSVQKAFYQIINDRQSGSYSFSDDIGLIAAGNRVKDKSGVREQGRALKDRYNEVELIPPSISKWTEWAAKNGIDDRIVGFLQAENSQYLINLIDERDEKDATPRGWERASNFIKGLNSRSFIKKGIGSAVGQAVASQFLGWLEVRNKLDVEHIFNNPETAELPQHGDSQFTDKYYALASGAASIYKDKGRKGKKKKRLRKLLKLSLRMEEEFGGFMLTMARGSNPSYFKKNAVNSDCWKDVVSTYRDLMG